MLKEIIQSFLPWILFFIISGHSEQQLDIAIIIAASTSIIFEFNWLKKGFILSWGTLIFFAFMFIAVILFRNQWVAGYSWIFFNVALVSIAWISILIRKPFTIQYAKEQISPDQWQHPLFLKINYLLTATWGILFLIGIGLDLLRIYQPSFNGLIYEIVSYIPSVFGIWFTTWFPQWWKEKYTSNQQPVENQG
jgi:hypothetical protein